MSSECSPPFASGIELPHWERIAKAVWAFHEYEYFLFPWLSLVVSIGGGGVQEAM